MLHISHHMTLGSIGIPMIVLGNRCRHQTGAQEAAEENAQIKESMGRIRNLLQDEQHQAKLELNAKAGHNKKLRL